MTDMWVCSACHSVNRKRDDRCYKCGARQSAAMAETGPDLRVQSAVANRIVRGYRPAWPFALIASALILAVAAMGLYLVLAQAAEVATVKAAFAAQLGGRAFAADDVLQAQEARLAGPTLLRSALLVLAVIAFGVWLSRIVMNVPALGGGTPSTTPVKALVYPMIPIVNLVKVPGMVNDVLYRVEPSAGGFFMVAVAWFGLVGSWFVSVIGQWWITLSGIERVVAAPTVTAAVAVFGSVVDQIYLLAIVVEAMIAGGALVLVLLMLRIERRAAARDREIRAAFLG